MDNTQVYKTKQRQSILNFFKNNKTACFTAEQIYCELIYQGEKVGKTTVYRYINMLAKEGSVTKFVAEKGQSCCYQYAVLNDECKNHFHFKCLQCKKTIHLNCSFLNNVGLHIKSEHNLLMDNYKTVLYGLCEQCQNYKK